MNIARGRGLWESDRTRMGLASGISLPLPLSYPVCRNRRSGWSFYMKQKQSIVEHLERDNATRPPHLIVVASEAAK